MSDPIDLDENGIQRQVFKHFAARKERGVFAFHPKNGSSDMRGRRRGVYGGLGVVSGIPDVIVSKFCCEDGPLLPTCRNYALELKRESRRGKTPTAHEKKQAECRAELEKCGWITGCTYGLNDTLKWLESHGLLKGTSR